MSDVTQATQVVSIVEIRARHDRNRLLGTYDPARRLLRLFHRGQQITVNLAEVEYPDFPRIEPYVKL
jgi:hypothetical protein